MFNHTAEGGEGGPSLCFRGLDNTAYYRLDPGHPDQYYDTTGTGNSLNAGNPVALRLRGGSGLCGGSGTAGGTKSST